MNIDNHLREQKLLFKKNQSETLIENNLTLGTLEPLRKEYNEINLNEAKEDNLDTKEPECCLSYLCEKICSCLACFFCCGSSSTDEDQAGVEKDSSQNCFNRNFECTGSSLSNVKK